MEDIKWTRAENTWLKKRSLCGENPLWSENKLILSTHH